jgi:two-component system, chemotaxis family, protein-glutamate methylesterase/glutaminase
VDSLRVMVVDDTSLYRMLVTNALRDVEGVEVVGSAPDGKAALGKIEQLKPDLITLDVEMPVMDGLTTLEHLRQQYPKIGVVMVSSLTQRGAETTLHALDLGAFDFVGKPDGKDVNANREALTSGLKRVVQAFTTRRSLQPLMKAKPAVPARAPLKVAAPAKIEAVAIGISTGGPNALGEMVPMLPGDLGVPVFIVQHMPPRFTAALAATLDLKSSLKVVEGADGQKVEAGTVYIAPGGLHMKVKKRGTQTVLETTQDPPEHHCRPAVDYLFRSIAEVYGKSALGVIMTGMGSDGAKGLAVMKQKGSHVLAQDEESCVVFGMPMEAVKAGVTDEQLPLGQIAARITSLVKGVGG